MIPDISNAIILFGGGLALLHGLTQLLRPGRSVNNLLLFAIFASLTVIQLQEFIVSATPRYSTEGGMMALLTAKFILGPSIYLFYRSGFLREGPPAAGDMVHLVPLALISPVIIIMLLPESIRAGAMSVPADFIVAYSLPGHLHALGFALILGYIVAILSRMEVMEVIRDTGKDRLATIALIVIVTLFVIISMIILALITEKEQYSKIALLLISSFVIYWFIIGQIHPEIFLLRPERDRARERVDSLLQSIDAESMQQKIDSLIAEEKLYCDEDLTLKRLADLLSVQPQQLSVYLNHQLNMNFSTFINTFRVNEAINLMKEDSERPLLSIAYAVGFNSKSVFYDAFAKQTGMSPAKYRKSLKS